MLCAGVTPEQFKQEYQKGTVATIAELAGVPPEAVTATVEAPARQSPAAAAAAAPAASAAEEANTTAPAAAAAIGAANITAAAAPAAADANTTAAAAGRGSRRLLQDTTAAAAGSAGSLKVNFGVKTADASGTTAKLSEALKGNGETFYQVRGLI